MTMAGQILGIERFLHTHSNRVLAQFIYPQLRPKGRIFNLRASSRAETLRWLPFGPAKSGPHWTIP